jgi:hypothetical protein
VLTHKCNYYYRLSAVNSHCSLVRHTRPYKDGWTLNYTRAAAKCLTAADCSHGACTTDTGLCLCDPGWGGGDCSLDTCLGTHTLPTSTGVFKSAVNALEQGHRYKQLDCVFIVDLSATPNLDFVTFTVTLDAEETFDFLKIRQGAGAGALTVALLTGEAYLNVSVSTTGGKAELQFTTDTRGRRSGFVATFQAHASSADCAHLS